MPKNKKKNAAKNRQPMDPIEEEANQEARYRSEDAILPSNSDLFTDSPKMFRLQTPTKYEFTNVSATTYPASNLGPAHRFSQTIYHSAQPEFKLQVSEDMNANPIPLMNSQLAHEISKSKGVDKTHVVRLDENSSITKLMLDTSRLTTIENMFRPYVEKVGENAEISPPFDGKEKRKPNRFDSEVHFLNGGGKNEVRFVNVSKNNLSLHKLCYEYYSNEPKIQLCSNRQIPTSYDDTEYSCKCIAIDNSKENRIAIGLNSGDIFVTSAPVDSDFNWSTSYHIRMRQQMDSIVGLAFDKTTSGTNYLSCAYERGRESEHFISLYDVNKGKDLILDRDVSERILGMQFLSSSLSVLSLHCMKSVRFVDMRERSGFASIINLNMPLYKIAIEPYNNVQFAGVVSNNLTIFDRRFLSKALYDLQVGPKSYNISHLEWNPNRYANITCCSSSSNMMFELDILPAATYPDHISGTETTEPQESIVAEYANKFSYGLEKINTPLSVVQHFAWCRQKPNVMIVASPCTSTPYTELVDWTQLKACLIQNDRTAVCIPPEGSILYCDENGFNQIKLKPQVTHKTESQAELIEKKNKLAQLKSKQITLPESRKELDQALSRLQIAKNKPTFEMEPEEIDMIYEMEQEALKKRNEKIDDNHFEKRPEDIQRQIPFLAIKNKYRPNINKQLQLWFTRSDINQLSIIRAKLGYGFSTVPGSATALIENSYYAIKDRLYETDCLKNCWKMLTRIYSPTNNEKYTPKLLARYGTVFPGVRRMAHKLTSTGILKDEDKILFRIKYFVSEQRDQILRLVGWYPVDDWVNLGTKLERLISSPDIESKIRAAVMSMFYLQGHVGKEYLENILNFLGSNECPYTQTTIREYQLMITKMLEVIDKHDGFVIKDLEQVLEKIEDPYLGAMLRFLGRRKYKNYHIVQRQIMATDSLRLDDRLAIAAIHIDDETFRTSLEVLTNSLQKSHDPLSVLLISGLDDQKYSHLAIHAYLSQTNDIQTAALILCAGNCFRRSKIWETYDMRKPVMERVLLAITNNTLKNTRKYSLQIVCSYMEWLQANNLTLQKSYIMTFLRKKIEFPKNDPKIQAGRTQGLIACNFCNKPILPFINDSPDNLLLAQSLKMPSGTPRKAMSVTQSLQMAEIERRKMLPKSRGCPHCGRPLPRCLICKRVCIQQRESASKNVKMDEWFIWCTKCAHGGHLSHLRNWFSINQLCPAADCKCPCPKIDNILNADHQNKAKEELFDDSFLINGFNVNLLSATIESSARSRHNSEQDKIRLIKRLYMSPSHSQSDLDSFRRRGSNDSGVPLNMANPLKSICSMKSHHGFIGSDSNLTNEIPSNIASNIHDHPPIQEESSSYSEQSWNMTPEIVKQSNAMRKILQTQNLKQTLSQLHSHAEPEIIEEEKETGKRLLIESSDNLSVSEASRSQRKQHANFIPKRQNKLNRAQHNFETLHKSATINDSQSPNKWIVNGRDNSGRLVATQVNVDIEKPENESTSSQTLEKNVCFNQYNILLPVREHLLAKSWSTNPQALQQLVSTEMFKRSVEEERAHKDMTDKQLAAQLLKDQLAKEHRRKEAREHRKQMREKASVDRNLRKSRQIQTGSNYFSNFDYGSIDIQTISSESEDENREDAEEVAKLCAKVDENIRMEKEEIRRLQMQGFRDLNQLANSLKEAEERRKRDTKKSAKRVRIRTTPDIRIATPVSENLDSENSFNDISPRQRKNSTRNGAPSPNEPMERKSSAERKLSGQNKS